MLLLPSHDHIKAGDAIALRCHDEDNGCLVMAMHYGIKFERNKLPPPADRPESVIGRVSSARDSGGEVPSGNDFLLAFFNGTIDKEVFESVVWEERSQWNPLPTLSRLWILVPTNFQALSLRLGRLPSESGA